MIKQDLSIDELKGLIFTYYQAKNGFDNLKGLKKSQCFKIIQEIKKAGNVSKKYKFDDFINMIDFKVILNED